ncbi:MAG: right-handed parallel beta-helix repeat-containing protein [Planctomycetaceae bacterium]|nr:right-handed parallel beta-helix repeat-containing protein [Planctomycetaceae bacterium]
MHKAILIAVGCVVLAGSVARADEKADLFVSPDGKDSNAGTKDAPLASLAGARDAVRKIRAGAPDRATPIVVEFAAGFYPLEATVHFVPADSGTEKSPTIYRAAAGANVVISGGRILTGFKNDSKGRWTLEIPEAKCPERDPTDSEAWDAYLAKTELKQPSAGKWEFSQLFVNDQRRYRPRFPETSYQRANPGPPDEFGAKFKSEGTNSVSGCGGDPKWHNMSDVEFVLMNGWNTGRYRAKKIENDTLWVTGPGCGGAWWNGIARGRRYYLENIFDLMKEGNFYLDRKIGVLTYHPRAGETPENCTVIAPKVNRLLDFKGDLATGKFVEHLQFVGLTFAHANWNLQRGTPKGGRGLPQGELDVDAAIKGWGLRHSVFKGVTVRQIGQYALRLDAGCKYNRVEDSEFIDLGGGGIWLGSTHNGGWGYHDDLPLVEKVNKETGKKEMVPGDLTDELAASHNLVRNCLVAHVGRLHAGSLGIWLGQTHHTTVEHCDIFDVYYSGMNVGWNWGPAPGAAHDNIIQYNHISQIGQGVLADMAAIYTLGWSKGTVIRNNVLKDIWSHRNNQGCGFYNDSGSRLFRFENNLVIGANDGAYHNHQGHDITLVNNIFALNNGTIKMQESGPFTFNNNIVYWRHGYGTKGGARVDAANNLWSGKGGFRGEKNSLQGADPMFVDAAKGDFHLKPESPALKLGFKPFDYENAGRLKGFKRWSDLAKQPQVMYFDTRSWK